MKKKLEKYPLLWLKVEKIIGDYFRLCACTKNRNVV